MLKWKNVIALIAALCHTAALASAADSVGGPPLTHEAVINAPVAKVWHAFTTSEGLESWMAPHADVDLRVGGVMRSTYNANGTLGDESTIENTITSYLPERMLSFRNTKAPEGFPFKNAIGKTWSVLLFEPLENNRTRLTITGMGYGEDQESRSMREFFRAGNQMVLDKLKENLERGNASEKPLGTEAGIDPHLKSLARYVGGQWVVNGTWSNGNVLNGREIHESSLDGKVIRSRTYLPRADGSEYQRYETLTAWDERKQSLVYHSIAFDGSISGGTIEVIDDNTLLYPPAPHPDGKPSTISQTLKFTDDNTMVWNVYQKQADGTQKELIEATWRRIAFDDPLPYHAASTPTISVSAKEGSASSTDNAIEVESIVNAPLAEVWKAWTTNAGARQFLAPHTEIDLRIGGDYHIHFNPSGAAGTRGAETEKILSYLPQRMLSFEWGAPPQFAHARAHPCVVVVTFDAIGQTSTRVRLVHHGFAQRKADFPQHAEEYDQAREYFSQAWPKVLGWLKRRFDDGPRFDAQGAPRWN